MTLEMDWMLRERLLQTRCLPGPENLYTVLFLMSSGAVLVSRELPGEKSRWSVQNPDNLARDVFRVLLAK